MTKINFKPNAAATMAQQLDSKDGKSDGKISASVWNEFVKDKGGKTIKYSITVENAAKSISTYLSRNSQATGKSKDGLIVDWTIQTMESNKTKGKKGANVLDTSWIEEQNKKNALNPKTIEKNADAIAKFVTGKNENFTINPYNGAQVFLKASQKFKNGKLPSSLGTNLYLMSLFPSLVKKANALGIPTYYKEGQKFDDINKKLAACKDLALQISEKEKGLPQNKVILNS